jgi:anti-anti-sigma regulatory factor
LEARSDSKRVTLTAEWRFDYTFRIEITHDARTSCVAAFVGDLDAFTSAWLRKAGPIPTSTPGSFVLDLARLDNVDIAGVREIRRIERAINDAGGRVDIRGATADVQQMLDLIR